MKYIFRSLFFILLSLMIIISVWQVVMVCTNIAVGDYKIYLWFGVGIVAYYVLRIFPFVRKNAEWFETWTHELTHTIVGLLFFHKIHSFSAGEGDGQISHSGRFLNNIFITLAPYCLPIYTFIFCIIRIAIKAEFLPVIDALIGLSLIFHLHCFRTQCGGWQPDIMQFGKVMSYFFITAFLLFNLLFVFQTIKFDFIDGMVSVFKNYWAIINDIIQIITTKFIK